MIDNEFAPLISMLKARTDGIKPVIVRRVKKDLGVYDLLARKAALEEEIREIITQMNQKTDDRFDPRSRTYNNAIEREVNRRLDEINEPLCEITGMAESLKRSIKLSTAPSEVAGIFDRLSEEMKDLTQKYSSLPPITDVLKITEEEIALVEEGTRECN